MKKILQIIIGIIALGFIVVIARNALFTNADDRLYTDGWTAYDKGDYNTAIFYFDKIDKNKYPDVFIGLGSSYLKLSDYNNAINNLEKAYERTSEKNKDYAKIAVSLGMSYIYSGNLEKGRFYLEEARKLGMYDTQINFRILDSLESVQKIK